MRNVHVKYADTFLTVTLPSRDDIQNLKVGDTAPYCFGESEVTEIMAVREDIHGRLFACYYVRFGDNGQMSASIKEDEMVRTVRLCSLPSRVLDQLESQARLQALLTSV